MSKLYITQDSYISEKTNQTSQTNQTNKTVQNPLDYLIFVKWACMPMRKLHRLCLGCIFIQERRMVKKNHTNQNKTNQPNHPNSLGLYFFCDFYIVDWPTPSFSFTFQCSAKQHEAQLMLSFAFRLCSTHPQPAPSRIKSWSSSDEFWVQKILGPKS